MPGLLWVFFVGIGLAGGSALWGPPRAWAPVDPTARSGGHVEGGFYLQTDTLGVVEVDRSRSNCQVTVIAGVRGDRRARLQLDGVEQVLDTSWMVDKLIPAGTSEIEAIFLEPIGGEVQARLTTVVRCVATAREPARNPELYDSRGLRGYDPCPVK